MWLIVRVKDPRAVTGHILRGQAARVESVAQPVLMAWAVAALSMLTMMLRLEETSW